MQLGFFPKDVIPTGIRSKNEFEPSKSHSDVTSWLREGFVKLMHDQTLNTASMYKLIMLWDELMTQECISQNFAYCYTTSAYISQPFLGRDVLVMVLTHHRREYRLFIAVGSDNILFIEKYILHHNDKKQKTRKMSHMFSTTPNDVDQLSANLINLAGLCNEQAVKWIDGYN